MPDTSTPSTVQQELLTASGDTVLANIEAAATTSSVELTGVSVDSLADPQLQNSTTAVVASSLTLAGLSAEDAESAEAELAAAIASSLEGVGVAAGDVSITGYETEGGNLVVSFEVRLAFCRDGACSQDGRVQPSTEQFNSSVPTLAVHVDGPSKF